MRRGLSFVCAVLLGTSMFLAGCGGGGGGSDGGGQVVTPTVTGTAATGAAIAYATITLKDAAGTERTTTTDVDGRYSIDTTGLVPPFLVQVVAGDMTTYYSVSANADAVTVINVTPLTDLIIRSWYDVQGVTVDDAFADPAANPAPSPTVVAVIADVVVDIVQLWMDQAGVTADGFNLISTPFDADGEGIDGVLDQMAVDPDTGEITISDGTVTQDTTVTCGDGTIAVTTTTTDGTNTSSSAGAVVVPTTTPEQDAFDGITGSCNAFAAAVNAKSATTLTANDLLPYISQGALWSGLDRNQFAQVFAGHFQGMTIAFSEITVRYLDTVNNVAKVSFLINMSRDGQSGSERNTFFFKKGGDGVWRLHGNQQIADIDLRAGTTTNAGFGGENTSTILDLYAMAPADTVTGVSVTGGPWDGTPLDAGSTEFMGDVEMDSFAKYAVNPSVTGGMPFTLDFTKADASHVYYTKSLNAITTEPIYYTGGVTGSTIEDATLDSPKTVSWTLPATFPIAQLRIGTVAVSHGSEQDYKCDSGSGSGSVLSIDTTTATVTIPATCNGFDTYKGEIYVQAFGVNGEFTTAYYVYGGYM